MSSPQPVPVSSPSSAGGTGRAFIGPDGVIREANADLALFTGLDAAALPALPAVAAFAALKPSIEQPLRRALDEGAASVDLELYEEQPASGARRRWLLSLYPLRSRLGLVAGVDLELRPWTAPSPEGPAMDPAVAASLALLRGELERSDEPFRSIFDQAAVGLILVGSQGGLVRANPGFCAIVGYSSDELLSARSIDLTHPDDLAADREQIRRLMAGEPAPAIEKRYRHRDGHDVWVRVTRSLIRSPEGEVRFGLIVAQDISAEKQAREALRRSDALMRRVWEQAVFGVLLGDRDGTIRYANPALARILGYSVEELSSGLRWQDLTPPAYQARDEQAAAELLQKGFCPPYEKVYLARDGRLVPVLVGAALVERADGAGRLGAAFVTDLTAIKAAEAERERLLRAAEEARAAAEEAARRAVTMLSLTAALSRALTPERVAEAVLDEACGIFGAAAGVVALADSSHGELVLLGAQGFPAALIAPWRQIALATATPLSDAARRGEPVLLESPAVLQSAYPQLGRANPGSAHQAWAALPLKLDQQVIGALGLAFAVPREFDDESRTYLMTMAGLCAQALERARLSAAERAALSAADEALAIIDTVIDSAPIGIAYVDHEFRYRRINPALAAMNGRSVAEHIGRVARELFPAAAPVWEPYWRQVLETGEPVTGLVFGATAPDGSPCHAQVSFYPVRASAGPVLGVGILVIDITEQQRADEERARLLASEQAARAAAQEAQARAEAAVQLRDTFLSIAAHELKTPLTSLLGQAQLLERRLAAADQLAEPNARSLQVVVSQARRLSHLIADLLDGAHLELGQLTIKRRPVELGRLVRQIVEESQPTAPTHPITLALADGSTMVFADPVRLEQVLQNLLSNAVKYSPRGSEVRVELQREDGRALLAVGDQGVGIPEDALSRVFERFFRVASPETATVSGVGVGLYVVREIVRLHDGEVRVESVVGVGSTFTVELPLAD